MKVTDSLENYRAASTKWQNVQNFQEIMISNNNELSES